MNGETSQQMTARGIKYRKNYGISIPHIKEIAKAYSFTPQECERLWMMEIRETMLLAAILMPEDELTLRFGVPPARGNPAYLLRTRGYYYEWMRAPWLREENPARAHRLLADPASALRELAAPYHSQEAEMDAIFNASRFARPGAP